MCVAGPQSGAPGVHLEENAFCARYEWNDAGSTAPLIKDPDLFLRLKSSVYQVVNSTTTKETRNILDAIPRSLTSPTWSAGSACTSPTFPPRRVQFASHLCWTSVGTFCHMWAHQPGASRRKANTGDHHFVSVHHPPAALFAPSFIARGVQPSPRRP